MQERGGELGRGGGGKKDVRETVSSHWLLSKRQRAEGLSHRTMLLRPVSSLHSPQAAEFASQHTNACGMMVLMLL